MSGSRFMVVSKGFYAAAGAIHLPLQLPANS